jgi:flagellar hook-basal body complex protein FliE
MTPIAATPAINQVAPLSSTARVASHDALPTDKATFGSLVDHFINSTNRDQVASDQAVAQMVTGKTDNIQQVVLAVAKAELSFQLFMEIRNQLIDSYSELMRMQF